MLGVAGVAPPPGVPGVAGVGGGAVAPNGDEAMPNNAPGSTGRIDRTFIMKNNQVIVKNIKRKLTANEVIFRDKVVLILDDSIVRGNTSSHIIKTARKCGAKKIYFGSCSPVVKNTNQYGIYIPTKKELVSYNRNEEEIRKEIGVDHLIYNDLEEIKKIIKSYNPFIYDFETSMFED